MAKATSKRAAASGYADFMALSGAEKERVWASYNREIPAPELRPLTAAERQLHARGANGRGGGSCGTGRKSPAADARAVNVTLDRRLLRRADAYAKAHGLSRAQLVAQGLAAVIGAAAPARSRSSSPSAPRRRRAS